MKFDLERLAWPAARLSEALARVAAPGDCPHQAEAALPPPPVADGLDQRVGPWLEAAAKWLGLEALAVEVTYGNIHPLVTSAAPAVLRWPGSAAGKFLVLLASHRRRVTLLTPDLTAQRVPSHVLAAHLEAACEIRAAGPIDTLVRQAGLSRTHGQKARTALLREVSADEVLGSCWLLRPAAGARLTTLARKAGLGRLLGCIALSHLSQCTLWILAWWLLGWMSVRGRFDSGLFWAWMLLLVALVPFRFLTGAAEGTFAIRAGALLKRRLLAGALRLEPDEVRHWGVGQLLGRVIECEAVESLAVRGGFLALTAVVELLLTTIVLGLGPARWLHVVLLLAGATLAVAMGIRLYRRRRAWTQQRLSLTNELVERMIGHRTRLAQEPRAAWNRGEDEALEGYLESSRQMDYEAAVLPAVIPRGWLIAGLLGLAPDFLAGGQSAATLAVGLGGVLLAYQALRRLSDGCQHLAGAALAWERMEFLSAAASRREPVGWPTTEVLAPSAGRSIVAARQLVFGYRHRGQPVLQGLDLVVHPGERLLLEGASGAGKSTLTAVLAGNRVPESGLLLLHGLDRETLGAEAWRRRVVVAPQFHENHVLLGTLAFNLLLGGRWPPRPDDLEEAERTCRALGLGPLLERMPSGMFQMIGETGWQLSHGEKSRLYIARALLQRADLTILDESFAALDPQNLQRTLTYVLEQAPTLLVVAHP